MDRDVQARVYPRELRPGFAKRNLRFYRTLASMLLRHQSLKQLRLLLTSSSPALVRRLIWVHYLKPSATYKAAALSAAAQRSVETLKRDGIVALDRKFAALADYVRTRYLSPDFELPADSSARKNGLEISHSLSFSDQRLHDVFFDPEICGLVCNYYSRQAYYRDNPTVHRERFGADSTPLVSGVFHSDGYRQISFMLLLSDLTESDTHMEYAKGSHRGQQPSYERAHIDQAAVPREFEIVHVVGEKGTLFVFDTEGLHRGAHHRNGRREMLHVNITTGTIPFTSEKYESLAGIFPDSSHVSAHVRNFVVRAVK